MPRRRTALTGLTSLAALVLSSGSAHAAPAGPRLIRDVQAGRDTVSESAPVQADTTTEPSVAVNPANPLNVVLGYQMGRVDAGGDATNGFATTFDGGRTWTYGKVPGITRVDGGPYDRASDAVVAFGPHNTVYYSSLAFDDTSDQGLRSAVVNSTSHDGGRHWDAFTTVIDDLAGGLNDKNWVTVDDGTGAGHHPGRVYVAWDRIDPMLASYSDDEGRTWAAPSLVYPGPSIGATPLVQPSGDLAVVLEEDVGVVPVVHPSAHEDVQEPVTGLTRIAVAVAHGAGSVPTGAPLAFAPAVTVATYQNNPVRQQRAGTLPSADVDPRTGRLYVTWEDARYRSDLENDVVVSSSADGIVWTTPLRVNGGIGRDEVDHWNASVAVARDGTVWVMYRQRQEAADLADFSPYIDTFVAYSRDAGRTWTRPTRVDTTRTDVRFAAYSRGGAFLGDYNEIAVGGDYAYATYCTAFAPRPGAPAAFPPLLHHQTTWLAVLTR